MSFPREGDLVYQPSRPPQTGDMEAVKAWMVGELERIANQMNQGRFPWLYMDSWDTSLVPRPREGMVIVDSQGPAGRRGLWQYINGSWSKV